MRSLVKLTDDKRIDSEQGKHLAAWLESLVLYSIEAANSGWPLAAITGFTSRRGHQIELTAYWALLFSDRRCKRTRVGASLLCSPLMFDRVNRRSHPGDSLLT